MCYCFSGTQLGLLWLKGSFSPPPTHPPPYMQHSWYLVSHLKNQQIQLASNCMTVYWWLWLHCKSYVAIIKHKKVMWYWIFKFVFIEILQYAHKLRLVTNFMIFVMYVCTCVHSMYNILCVHISWSVLFP